MTSVTIAFMVVTALLLAYAVCPFPPYRGGGA